MNHLIGQIRAGIRRTDVGIDTAKRITDVLVRNGLDLRREPSLEDMKRILVGVCRPTRECRCMA